MVSLRILFTLELIGNRQVQAQLAQASLLAYDYSNKLLRDHTLMASVFL